MRMFVAIDLNEDVIGRCMRALSSLKESGAELKPVKPENLHITLKFLGEVREDDLDRISVVLEGFSGRFRPFRLALSGIGYFGSEVFPRVIWAGISEGGDIVSEMSDELNRKLVHIRDEHRNPHPHLTLARARSPENSGRLAEAMKKLSDVKLGEVDVKEIKLRQSILRPDGPVYSDLRSFRLGIGKA